MPHPDPTTPPHRYDVVIVGAGPTGLTLANQLGLYGVRTLLVEAERQLIDYPRGVGMDDESLRAFQHIGLVDEVRRHTTPHQIMRFVNGRGALLAELAPRTDEFGWPRRNAFIQPLVDAELFEGTRRFTGVDVRFGHRMERFAEVRDAVEVELADADGARHTVRARYLVGSDGGRSLTRKSLGLPFEGATEPTRWLVVDLRNDPLGTPNAYLGCDPSRPYVSIGLPHGIRRFEFMLFPHEDDAFADDETNLHRLLAPLVPDPAGVDLIRRRVYTHSSRVAGAFRKGRVLVAGDAAHLMPVWQGQGFNSGIRDAVNLGWKLACVVHGSAGERLLDSYDSERRHHAAAMVALSDKAGKVISPTNRLVAGVRDAVFRGLNVVPAAKDYVAQMRFKPMPHYERGVVVHPDRPVKGAAPCVGRLFIQPHVATRDRDQVLLDDVTGLWFTVLAWNNNPLSVLDDRAADLWRRLGAHFVEARPMCQLHWAAEQEPDSGVTVVGDLTGRLKEWFDRRPESFVVLRPDRFVAGAALAQNATALTHRLADALHLIPGGPDVPRPVLPVALPADGVRAATG
ncbi:bifunctional 3-(3-hydroxy-phenyl)propionate/3-hydroxycinnamic acid hydroxylase [Streptomyces sp. SID13726]|uniref:bifunctional 3-(3-hydroxy-phenyl)propionate/3-hydroxycinnamic acid hydroxylase n=1 Tax=Streptomyces sp. SID13726 TaxID=2706058 RepID=UPI0013BA6A0B|nr:bifunctional 3-(3-hydroxy-phenyl)propionate/3-hydroxycinnamic acid hydroxylase [Streptomyces sp. SID13726]NEB03500.1 bifunctional 3-(3-hydroxy-phenyl)propionate/3-hydroxycinnamic acid hydroxylase [Streptomyces sp. SID13726]